MSYLLSQSSPGGGGVGVALFYIFALMAGGAAVGVAISRNVVRMAVALLFTLMGLAGLYFLLNAEFLAAVQLVVYAGGTLILIVFGVMLTTRSPFSRSGPKLGEIAVAITLAVVLVTALVMAIPVSATAEKVGQTRLRRAFDIAPPGVKARLQYDGEWLWYRGRMTPADRAGLLASVEAEYQDMRRDAPDAPDAPALDQQHADLVAAVERLNQRSQRFFLLDRPLPTEQGYPVALLGQKLLGGFLLPFELASVLLLVVMIGAAYLAKGRRRPEAGEQSAALSRDARNWT